MLKFFFLQWFFTSNPGFTLLIIGTCYFLHLIERVELKSFVDNEKLSIIVIKETRRGERKEKESDNFQLTIRSLQKRKETQF